MQEFRSGECARGAEGLAAWVFEPENSKIADENAMIKLSGPSRPTRAQGQGRGLAGQYLIDALRGSIEAGSGGHRRAAIGGPGAARRCAWDIPKHSRLTIHAAPPP